MSEAIGESQLLIKTPDHQQLFVKQNRPLAPQAVLVVVHGLGGHQGRYDYLTNWFVTHYVAVYRYDHRGHGQTPGVHGVYGNFNHFPDDLKTVVDWAKKTRRICQSLSLVTVWAAARRWHLVPNIQQRSMALFPLGP
ncbi:alpha/beta hydrolase [Limosilactobacillus mucosae]|nr:alpha/beta hydrolase [Limosilactobacillus mucosae]MDM8219561.1 alpha/beta hydrolase [Limosilactobacillus mucosae]MDM8314217.1 alpha/beta hydrolase [Limosilactobacillus mucosae]